LIEPQRSSDKMAVGLGCGVGGAKPPIGRVALLAKQSHGDGIVDLAKQSQRQAQALLAEQSQREARVGFGGTEPVCGRRGSGETNPTGRLALIWRNKPNAAAQF
jgi:hypothetical protein